jgi:hypothetical protein
VPPVQLFACLFDCLFASYQHEWRQGRACETPLPPLPPYLNLVGNMIGDEGAKVSTYELKIINVSRLLILPFGNYNNNNQTALLRTRLPCYALDYLVAH